MYSFTIGTGASSELPQFKRLPRFLLLHVEEDGAISPSRVAQAHISQRADNSSTYPVSKAVELMSTAAQLGFGEMSTCTTTLNKRKVTKMVKNKYAQLPSAAKNLLQTFGISQGDYEASFGSDSAHEC